MPGFLVGEKTVVVVKHLVVNQLVLDQLVVNNQHVAHHQVSWDIMAEAFGVGKPIQACDNHK
jgi:hypothetical protein